MLAHDPITPGTGSLASPAMLAVPAPVMAGGKRPGARLRSGVASGLVPAALAGGVRRPPARKGADERSGEPAAFVVGTAAIEPCTVAHVVQARGAATGLDPKRPGGFGLRCGTDVHPTKRFGRLKGHNVVDGYLEPGEASENHALNGVL